MVEIHDGDDLSMKQSLDNDEFFNVSSQQKNYSPLYPKDVLLPTPDCEMNVDSRFWLCNTTERFLLLYELRNIQDGLKGSA